ncbi:MAG: hypothetical protein SCH71_02955 [Desulfobulbaceae bacterium]|nr:hypothetical protein [Desulfobulbaceae bacterium]
MKHLLKYFLLSGSFAMFFCPNLLWAEDDVLNIVDEAVKQYKGGDYSGASSNLDYASQLIRQKKSELMKDLLPEPLPGWDAEEAEAQALGTAVFGGGINVSRRYVKKSAAMTIDIITDAPVMQSLVLMINNPMLAGASGSKLESIKGQKAIVQYNAEKRGGEVNIVIGNRILVTVKGKKVDRNDLVAYAAAVDYDLLNKN